MTAEADRHDRPDDQDDLEALAGGGRLRLALAEEPLFDGERLVERRPDRWRSGAGPRRSPTQAVEVAGRRASSPDLAPQGDPGLGDVLAPLVHLRLDRAPALDLGRIVGGQRLERRRSPGRASALPRQYGSRNASSPAIRNPR